MSTPWQTPHLWSFSSHSRKASPASGAISGVGVVKSGREVDRTTRPWTSDRVSTLPWVGSRLVELEGRRLRRAGRSVLDLTTHPKRPPPAHVVEAATRAMQSLELPPS